MKFESLEAAIEHVNGLNQKISDLRKQVDAAEVAKLAAEEIAKDAIEKANATLEGAPKQFIVTVHKAKYKVVFGVDGLTKEELAKDAKLCAKLISKKSGALELVED